MAETNSRLKRNLYFIIAFAALSLSVLFAVGTVITLQVVLASDETSVGHIYLGNRTESDYASYLERQVSEWRTSATYELGFQGVVYPLDLDVFFFDVDTTIEELVRDEDNRAVFTLSADARAGLLEEMTAHFTATVLTHFNETAFFDDLLDDISHLYRIKTYRLTDYMTAESSQTILASIVIDDLLAADVVQIIAAVQSIDISPRARFSLLERLASTDLDNNQLSILASGMQAVTGNTRFQSFLYWTFSELPLWSEIGTNVRILRVNGLDFSFSNPMDNEYRFIVTQVDATSIRIDLLGVPYVETLTSVWERVSLVPFAITTIEDLTITALTPGVIVIDTEEETIYRIVVQEGIAGEIWVLNRSITGPFSATFEERLAIDERPSLPAVYRENIVSKGGD